MIYELKFIHGAILDHHMKEDNAGLVIDQVGATTSFIGRVRADIHENKKVIGIDFTANKELAIERSREITAGILSNFNLLEVKILHSLGEIEVGEACFYVEVKSKHRKEAFDCLPLIVDQIKKQCPIFGKEILEDGSYVWKKNKN